MVVVGHPHTWGKARGKVPPPPHPPYLATVATRMARSRVFNHSLSCWESSARHLIITSSIFSMMGCTGAGT